VDTATRLGALSALLLSALPAAAAPLARATNAMVEVTQGEATYKYEKGIALDDAGAVAAYLRGRGESNPEIVRVPGRRGTFLASDFGGGTGEDVGRCLFLLQATRGGVKELARTRGSGDAYNLTPVVFSGGGRTVVLAELGTEYSWGVRVFEVAGTTLRELGAMMNEAFAVERAQVDGAVAEQLRLLRQSPEAAARLDIVRLPSAAAASYAGVSGANPALGYSGSMSVPQGTAMLAHPPALQTYSQPPGGGDSGSGSRRYGNTGMALATGGSIHPPPQHASSRGGGAAVAILGVLGAAVLLVGVVVLGPRAKSAASGGVDAGAGELPTAAATAPAPNALGPNAPSTATNGAAGAGTAAAPNAANAAEDAASATDASSASQKAVTGAHGGKTGGSVRTPPTAKPAPNTAATGEPVAPPKTTKPDLGY
jgi:hypothetical protein